MRILNFTIFLMSCTISVQAAAPNIPVFDGRILEYDNTDLRGTFIGSPAWAGAAISNLFVTWDETNLYVALQCRMDNTKVSVLMDVDPGNGTGATTTTNWVNGTNVMFIYNDNGWKKSDQPGALPFGLDFMLATEGFYNSVTLVLYDGVHVPNTNIGKRLFDIPDVGNGNVPVGTAVEMVVLKDNVSSNQLKGFETRIPWNILYGANANRFGFLAPGKVVPTGATVRLFANIHNNSPVSSFSAPDTIPAQTSANASYNAGTGLLISDNYIDVVIDQNNDGFPDLAPDDINAPYLTKIIGIAGSASITGIFNEAISESSVTLPSNWFISNVSVQSITQIAPNRAVITVSGPLPTAGSLLPVQTQGIEDRQGNHRLALNYLVVRKQPHLSSHTSMSVAGDFQGWNPAATNMVMISDHTWMYDVAINSSSGIYFKFAANGSWTTNCGRGAVFASSLPLVDVAGNPGGADIRVSNVFSGVYRFVFNEQTKNFSLVKTGTDTDHDGLPDEWEVLYGLLPTDNGSLSSLNGNLGDGDGDFMNQYQEYTGGTDPHDPFSYHAVWKYSQNTSGAGFITVPTSTGRYYTVEYSSGPPATSWLPLGLTNLPGTGEPVAFIDTNAAQQRVYRVIVRD
jgi:hypothetical protein